MSDTATSSCGTSCVACPVPANGSATCSAVCGVSCSTGFTASGGSCVDVNECLTNNGGCSTNATCTNTTGSRTCACNAGFTGDGVSCTDVNECLTNNGGCHANASCTNTPGSRTCMCNSGYTGNGLTCQMGFGERCETATLITSGATLSGTTAGVMADYMGFGAKNLCEASNNADVAFSATVPPGQRGTFTVNSSVSHGIELVGDSPARCTARDCLSGRSGTGSNQVSFTNGGTTTTTIYAIVSSRTGGPFTLTYQLDTPPVGDTCLTAQPLTAGTTVTNQALAGFTIDYMCSFITSRLPDRVYRVPVPAMSRLSASMTATFSGSVSLIAGPASACDSTNRVCLSLDGAADATMTNRTSVSQDVFVIASGRSGTGTFSLTPVVTSLPAGDVCENAQPLPLGTSTISLLGFGTDVELGRSSAVTARAGCTHTFEDLDRVYSATVAAGATLTVTATPPAGSSIDPILNLLPAPATSCNDAAVACLASADVGNQGAAETISWQNTTGSARTVLLVITSYLNDTGSFTLTASIQ